MQRMIQLWSRLSEDEHLAVVIAVVWLVILSVGTWLGLLNDPY